jgi:DNA-directed RNA polymerase subunit RPC12/RpoP
MSIQTVCTTCGKLSDLEHASQKHGRDDGTSLPPEAGGLMELSDLSPEGSRRRILLACPECGTRYLYESDYTYLANGSEDEQTLTRLTPEEAEDLLRG